MPPAFVLRERAPFSTKNNARPLSAVRAFPRGPAMGGLCILAGISYALKGRFHCTRPRGARIGTGENIEYHVREPPCTGWAKPSPRLGATDAGANKTAAPKSCRSKTIRMGRGPSGRGIGTDKPRKAVVSKQPIGRGACGSHRPPQQRAREPRCRIGPVRAGRRPRFPRAFRYLRVQRHRRNRSMDSRPPHAL